MDNIIAMLHNDLVVYSLIAFSNPVLSKKDKGSHNFECNRECAPNWWVSKKVQINLWKYNDSICLNDNGLNQRWSYGLYKEL